MYAIITEEMLDELSALERDTQCQIIMSYIHYELYGSYPELSSDKGYGYSVMDLCNLLVTSKRKELDRLKDLVNPKED